MASRQNVVTSLAGRASDATVRAETIGDTWLSIRLGTLVTYVHNQRVIREMRRAIKDAQRLAEVQNLPEITPTMAAPSWNAASIVHFGESISSSVYFDGQVRTAPHIRIETPPVTWLVLDQIALEHFSDLWLAAEAFGTQLPGALPSHDQHEVSILRNWAKTQSFYVRDFETEALLHLANGESVPWLKLLPGTRANQLRYLGRMYRHFRATGKNPDPTD